MQGRSDEINVCIACNQACLDHVFQKKTASCLVNPRACHETELQIKPASTKKKIGIIGAGPAGMAAAVTAAERGHSVSLIDAASEIAVSLIWRVWCQASSLEIQIAGICLNHAQAPSPQIIDAKLHPYSFDHRAPRPCAL